MLTTLHCVNTFNIVFMLYYCLHPNAVLIDSQCCYHSLTVCYPSALALDTPEMHVSLHAAYLVGDLSKSQVLPECRSGDAKGELLVEGIPNSSDFSS